MVTWPWSNVSTLASGCEGSRFAQPRSVCVVYPRLVALRGACEGLLIYPSTADLSIPQDSYFGGDFVPYAQARARLPTLTLTLTRTLTLTLT